MQMPQKMPQFDCLEICPRYRMPQLKTAYKKGWMVEFYCSMNGNFVRKQIRVDKYRKQFPDAKTAKLWIQENIILPLVDKLRNGELIEGRVRLMKQQLLLSELIDMYDKKKFDEADLGIIRKSSYDNLYKSNCNAVRMSMSEEQGQIIPDCKISEITPAMAEEFIKKYKCLRDVSVTTANNMIKFMRMVFNFAMEGGYLSRNPFERVKLLKGEVKGKRPLTAEEQSIIARHLLSNDLPFYIYTQLVFADLIRPVEIFRLKCKDIDAENFSIRLSASITKNRKPRTVLIPVRLRELWSAHLANIDFANMPKEAYLFHNRFMPAKSDEPLSSAYATRYWREMRRKLGLSEECKLYGLRHTGIMALLDVLPPNDVRLHADHSSIKQTMQYADHESDERRSKVAQKAPIYGQNKSGCSSDTHETGEQFDNRDD